MKKEIYCCPNCGEPMGFSNHPNYTFYCKRCAIDFHEDAAIIKTEPNKVEIEDYTDLVEASMKIKELATASIEASKKQIEIKGNDMMEQIAQYIHATIKPILESEIYKNGTFKNFAAIYYHNLKLYFGRYVGDGPKYSACLYLDSDYHCVSGKSVILFNKDEYKVCSTTEENKVVIAELWSGLKESMNRMLKYAFNEYNKAMQKEVENQQKKVDVIDRFKL